MSLNSSIQVFLNLVTSHLIQASKQKKELLYIIDIFKYQISVDYKNKYTVDWYSVVANKLVGSVMFLGLGSWLPIEHQKQTDKIGGCS